MNAIENWADVEELIRSLLPPKIILNRVGITIIEEGYGLVQEELEWLKRVEAARVSLGKEAE